MRNWTILASPAKSKLYKEVTRKIMQKVCGRFPWRMPLKERIVGYYLLIRFYCKYAFWTFLRTLSESIWLLCVILKSVEKLVTICLFWQW